MDLDSRLSSCIGAWRLQNLCRLDGGFRSEVFACTTAEGGEVVLKLTGTPAEARTEAAALSAWSRTGAAARLLDADFEHAALLLDRIMPGTSLPSGHDSVAIEVAAELLKKLHKSSPGCFAFPPRQQTYMEGERLSREDAVYEQRASGDPARGVAGLQRLDAARAVVMHLCATTERAVLLHGDFLDKNLLWNGTAYMAIDPIPSVGDPCSDVGVFAACHPPAAGILPRAAAIAARIDLDPRRAQQWAAVSTALQATQAWRPDQSELETYLSSGEFERLLTDTF